MNAHHRLFAVFSVVAAMSICNRAWANGEASGVPDQFSIGGYTSVGIQLHPGGEAEAALNEVSLILNWDGGSRLRAFAEFEVEKPLTWQEGRWLDTRHAYFDVERLYAEYSINGGASVRAGRFLTPVGRWNLLHAAPLVWTSTRPGATRQLFPLAINGVMLFGALPWAENALEYSVFAEAVKDQTNDPGETRFEKTRGIRIAYSGPLEVGLTLAHFREEAPQDLQHRMVGLDFFKNWNGWEFSGEAYQRTTNRNIDDSGGAYLQAAAPLGGDWFAVGRLENLREADQGTTSRWLLGTAWRQTRERVFKLEYVGGHEAHPEMPRGLIASYAILF